MNQKLSETGIGSTPVARHDKVLVYYTTFDPNTFATQPTLGLGASSRSPKAGSQVTFTVKAFDDAGVGTPVAGAWVWVNGAATRTDANGQVKFQTIFPGWYMGHTVHIHFKVRGTNPASGQNFEFTSQLFFDEPFSWAHSPPAADRTRLPSRPGRRRCA